MLPDKSPDARVPTGLLGQCGEHARVKRMADRPAGAEDQTDSRHRESR